MRIIDCKEERCKEICKGAPRTIGYLCDDCKAHFEGLKRCLNAANVDYIVDTDIVRGLIRIILSCIPFLPMPRRISHSRSVCV